MARPKKHPPQQIGRGVRLALESERPIAPVAADLGTRPETLRKHVRQVEAGGGKRPDLMSSQEREGIPRLRKENYELRCANEILKSASVSFVSVDARPGTCAKRRLPRGGTSQGNSRLRWVEVSERRGVSVKVRGISGDWSCGSCGPPIPCL
jgi:transposase